MVNVRSLWYQTIAPKVNEVEVVSSLRSGCLQGDDFNVMSRWLGSGARRECGRLRVFLSEGWRDTLASESPALAGLVGSGGLVQCCIQTQSGDGGHVCAL